MRLEICKWVAALHRLKKTGGKSAALSNVQKQTRQKILLHIL